MGWNTSHTTQSTKTTNQQSPQLDTSNQNYDAAVTIYWEKGQCYVAALLNAEDGILYLCEFAEKYPKLADSIIQSLLMQNLPEEAAFIKEFVAQKIKKPVIRPRKVYNERN